MKQLIAFILFITLPFIVSAQCVFRNVKTDSSMEYITRDDKGNIISSNIDRLEKITNTASGKVMHIVSESKKEGKEQEKTMKIPYSQTLMENKLTVSKDLFASIGAIIVSNALAAADTSKVKLKVDVTGDDILYELNPQLGKILPAYKINVDISVSKLNIPVWIECSDRKYVNKEQVTVPAGTFDAFVLEETMVFSFKVVGIEKTEKELQEIWLVPEIGMVKKITYDKKRKIKEIRVLSKINNK
jgi:hypothetical protein